jgi:hypothetical protein
MTRFQRIHLVNMEGTHKIDCHYKTVGKTITQNRLVIDKIDGMAYNESTYEQQLALHEVDEIFMEVFKDAKELSQECNRLAKNGSKR